MKKNLSRELAELEKLTKAREQAALSALAGVAAKKSVAARRVVDLMTTEYQATTADQMAQVSKWYSWRDQELEKRNAELAAIEAEYRLFARNCSRFVAEQAVVEELLENAKRDEALLRKKRQAFHIS